MPKIPKGKLFVKFLVKRGFEIVRQRGSHVILKGFGQRLVVPVHGGEELKLGLFKSILKDIGLSDEEFWNQF